MFDKKYQVILTLHGVNNKGLDYHYRYHKGFYWTLAKAKAAADKVLSYVNDLPKDKLGITAAEVSVEKIKPFRMSNLVEYVHDDIDDFQEGAEL